MTDFAAVRARLKRIAAGTETIEIDPVYIDLANYFLDEDRITALGEYAKKHAATQDEVDGFVQGYTMAVALFTQFAELTPDTGSK